jgi:hypothetical protein
MAGPTLLATRPIGNSSRRAEEPHDGVTPTARSVGYARRGDADLEGCDCGPSDLPGGGQRALQFDDLDLQPRRRGGALLRLALGLRQPLA